MIKKLQHHSFLMWLSIMSWLILPILGVILGSLLGLDSGVRILAIVMLSLSIPLTIMGLIALFANFKGIDTPFSGLNWIQFVLFLVFSVFIGLLIDKSITLDQIFGICIIAFYLLKWPLVVIGGLGIIYGLVKFIKWSRKH